MNTVNIEPESEKKDVYSVCFVSAFFSLRKTPFFTQSHPEEWNPESLIDIVSIGVPFCLYIGKECIYESLFREWETIYPNFRIMSYRTDYHDTIIHKTCIDLLEMGIPVSLPEKRNVEKDTYEYLVYMNSRVELMEDAISENVWNTTHYAWIDYHSSSLFKHKQETLGYLRKISQKPMTSIKTLVVPGCWPKPENMKTIATAIHWRFCGSFFMGDTEAIQEFADLYRQNFSGFLEKYRCLPWEVNFWAYLEHECGWKPVWYKGDHNDTLVYVSADMYTPGLNDRIVSRTTYPYPVFDRFYPGSASYLFHGGKHLLNTRYVSYWVYPNGYYRFHNNDHLIENRNILSELDQETMRPIYYRKMNKLYDISGNEIMSSYTNKRKLLSEGLEDIRLYSVGDTVRFIATTYGYSNNEKSRMMIGTYMVDELEYRNCMIIQPPVDSMCEKNWVPLPKYNTETEEWDEWFVYKWHPFELGRIDPSGILRIERRFETNRAVFGKIRGSTTFTDYGDGQHLVGLVHFSEDHTPRHYYHMLVLLDRETLEPKQHSDTFFFEKLAIEFCIGMYCQPATQMYTFWISRFDRDPLMLTVRMGDIPFVL